MWLHPLSAQSHSHRCCPSENGTDAACSSQVEDRLSALGGKQSAVSATVLSSSLSLHWIQISIKLGQVVMKINRSPKFPSCWSFPMPTIMGSDVCRTLRLCVPYAVPSTWAIILSFPVFRKTYWKMSELSDERSVLELALVYKFIHSFNRQ